MVRLVGDAGGAGDMPTPDQARAMNKLDQDIKNGASDSQIKQDLAALKNSISDLPNALWSMVNSDPPLAYAANYLMDELSSSQLETLFQVNPGEKNVLVATMEKIYDPFAEGDVAAQMKKLAASMIDKGAEITGNSQGNDPLMQAVYIAQKAPFGKEDGSLLVAILNKMDPQQRQALLNTPDPANAHRTPLAQAKFVHDYALINYLKSMGAEQ